jgi:hypothetical protein
MHMEPLVVVLSFLAAVGLTLAAAYVTLTTLLLVMQRAVLPAAHSGVGQEGRAASPGLRV